MRNNSRTRLEYVFSGLILIGFGISVWLLGFMSVNLHCDQYSSFKLAVFDFKPHAEEVFEKTIPLIFTKPLGNAIRMYFFVFDILSFILFPITMLVLIYRSKITQFLFAICSCLFVMNWVNYVLSEDIQGERMKFMSQTLAFYFTLLMPMYFLCIKMLRRKESVQDDDEI